MFIADDARSLIELRRSGTSSIPFRSSGALRSIALANYKHFVPNGTLDAQDSVIFSVHLTRQ